MKHSPPTQKQNAKLVARWQRDSDHVALTELVERNRDVVWKPARGFAYRYKLEADDLAQVGYVGLIIAAGSYDVTKGKFRSYCSRVVRTGILEFVSRQSRSGTHIGSTDDRKLAVFGLGRVLAQLHDQGEVITPEAIADRLGITPELAAAINQACRPPLQLDQQTTASTAVIEELADERPDPEAALIAAETTAELEACLKLLSPKERIIVIALHVNDEPAGRVAKRLGLKRREVVEIGERALSVLRQHLAPA